MSLSDRLKDKAGPLPVWAWGVIVGLVIVGGMYWYSSRSKISSAETDAGQLVAYPDLDGNSAGGGGNGGTVVTDAGGVSGNAPQFTSNMGWETFALAALVKEGYSPLTVQQALEKYLHGGSLTAQEQVIVNLAISRYGLPPFGTDVRVETDPVKVNTPVAQIPGVTDVAVVPEQTRSVRPAAELNQILTSKFGNLSGTTYTWNGQTGQVPAGGTVITATSDGLPYIIDSSGRIVWKATPIVNQASRSTVTPTGTSSPAVTPVRRQIVWG